jgi:hypothetical protein
VVEVKLHGFMHLPRAARSIAGHGGPRRWLKLEFLMLTGIALTKRHSWIAQLRFLRESLTGSHVTSIDRLRKAHHSQMLDLSMRKLGGGLDHQVWSPVAGAESGQQNRSSPG